MDYIQLYANFLKKFLKTQRPLKVVFDCSNGSAGAVLLRIMNKELGINILNSRADGNFPGHGPNPLAKGAMRQLQMAVLKNRADLGVIFDADGDRLFLIDNLGRPVSADETGYLLLRELKPKKFVIGPIAGMLLKDSRYQILDSEFFISRVGHFYFKNLMREKKIPLGLEHSGHYYFWFPEFGGAVWDSGILAAIRILNFVSKLKTPLSEYLDKLPKYYRSGEINFELKNQKSKIKIMEKIERFYRKQKAKISKLDGLTAEFPDFWVNVRPSNTENLLRLNLEAKNKKILQRELKILKKLILK